MKIPPPLKVGLLDVLTGFLGLVLLLVLDFATSIKFDLRWFFIVGASFCGALGFLRGGSPPRNPWFKGLQIVSGLSVPILILSFTGMAFGAGGILFAFLLVSYVSICCGVLVRRTWLRNRRMAIFTFLLIPLGCVVLASISLLPPLMGKLSGEHVNRPVPEFSLTTDDGKVLTSSHMRGKVVVLAFWATWCEPCWQELPRVEKVYASYQGNQAVLFWAVNARAGGDTDGVAQAYAKKMRVGLPVAYTENANAIRLGVDGYPTIVLLDAPVAFASFTMATMVRNGLNLISRARLRTCSTREADIFGHPADIGIRSISPHYYYLHKYRSYVALGCGLARRSSP